MLSLHPIQFSDIQSWFRDFQKKSKCYETPPDNGECIGIVEDFEKLVGYFIIQGYVDHSVDIVQGYLTPEARHKRFPALAMTLLEAQMKRTGYNIVRLVTNNRFKSYTEFMDGLGYRPEKIVFRKEL